MARKERYIDREGYIRIFVGKKHHLADQNGYMREHRVIAERMSGRLLNKGEEIHHKDGNKINNNPDNLEILNRQEHKERHRKKNRNLRKIGESNPIIFCACGCGKSFEKYDKQGRPRKYTEKCAHKWRKGLRSFDINIKIFCACGCGAELSKYDKYGRERKYISGHNGRK
jgi:hypothetical protein